MKFTVISSDITKQGEVKAVKRIGKGLTYREAVDFAISASRNNSFLFMVVEEYGERIELYKRGEKITK